MYVMLVTQNGNSSSVEVILPGLELWIKAGRMPVLINASGNPERRIILPAPVACLLAMYMYGSKGIGACIF
jgi:hypothetical protein